MNFKLSLLRTVLRMFSFFGKNTRVSCCDARYLELGKHKICRAQQVSEKLVVSVASTMILRPLFDK